MNELHKGIIIRSFGKKWKNVLNKQEILSAVLQIIDLKWDIDIEDYPKTVLDFVCCTGDIQLLNYFSLRGVNIDPLPSDNDNWRHPLFYAIIFGHKNVIKFYNDKGFNFNKSIYCKNRTTATPLMIAVTITDELPEMLDFVLQYKQDINKKNSDGNTALIIACMEDSLYAVKKLLLRKANVNIVNNDGKIALYFVKSDTIFSLLLMNTQNINHKDNMGNTVLICFINEFKVEYVTKLLYAGADPNISNKNFETPLSKCIELQIGSIYELLIDYGATL